MKVECVVNKTSAIPPELSESIKSDTGVVDSIQVGKEYVVYAIGNYRGHIWYYIADEYYSEYPIWHPEIFFKILDPRVSSYWQVSVHENEINIGFKEWIADRYFYESLTNGNKKALEIFSKYKRLMDEEFPESAEDDE